MNQSPHVAPNRKPNRLINETSPYLLQHAYNPVDWQPWSPAALQKAKDEDKPIFLSIGYAACHWCHVMEHESFEDEATAHLMNEDFVSIKVDREERPDLDSIYMNAVVALTGQGGWPMSVFLTPDGVPFYGGTYYPNTRRYGMPAFQDVLIGIANAWKNRRADILSNGIRLEQSLRRDALDESGADAALEARTLEDALAGLHRAFDWTNGGWGGAPKFPQPMALEYLIRRYTQTRDDLILRMIMRTLDKMARGGMYDQLGGGFHRYATDEIWLVPHFEKMLYDNAQLARVYLHAYQISRSAFYRRIAEETLDYVAREMTHAHGGFFSSTDADSEGDEGKFFVWTLDEIRDALCPERNGIEGEMQPEDDAQLFIDAYGITEHGNFEGKNILFAARDEAVLAELHKTTTLEIERRLAGARQRLFALRETRVRPARDEKVLTGWNGLMLAAFAQAARVLKKEKYLAIAERNADFILRELRDAGERLQRSWKDGVVKQNGFLEDYANYAEGLLALYETTFDAQWFDAARELADTLIRHFADTSGHGGFFDTSDDHETLITRPKDVQDNATPSGNAMAITVLLKLAAYTGEARYAEAAERALRMIQTYLARYPTGFAQWLCAFDFALSQPKEIAVVAPEAGDAGQALLDAVFAEYRPHQVVAYAHASDDSPVPLLRERPLVNGRATAYVCQNFVCQLPVNDAEALAQLLDAPNR